MTEVLVSAFKRCGFDLVEQSVQDKLQRLLESLDVDPSWAAKHYEIFQTRYLLHRSYLATIRHLNDPSDCYLASLGGSWQAL